VNEAATGEERMDVETWLEAAVRDAERRALPELRPLLEALADATRRLRDADWNDRADGTPGDV
jgi:hypothetical protein